MKFQSLDDFFINKNCIGNYENRIFFFSYQAIIAKIQIVYIYYQLKKKKELNYQLIFQINVVNRMLTKFIKIDI